MNPEVTACDAWWSNADPAVQVAFVIGTSLVLCVLIVVCAWYWDRGRRDE